MTDPTRGYTPGGFPRLASGKAKIPARPAEVVVRRVVQTTSNWGAGEEGDPVRRIEALYDADTGDLLAWLDPVDHRGGAFGMDLGNPSPVAALEALRVSLHAEGRHDGASEVASAVMLVDRLLRPVLSDQETP